MQCPPLLALQSPPGRGQLRIRPAPAFVGVRRRARRRGQANASGFGYLNFLAVGGISFLLVGHRFANRMNVEYQGHRAEGLIRIWPNSAPVVAWPPKYTMDRDLLAGITLPPSGFAATIWPPAEQSGVRR
jgi:hypothetical protein